MNEKTLGLIILEIKTLKPNIDTESLAKEILESLRIRGYYINKVKGDPSGRW